MYLSRLSNRILIVTSGIFVSIAAHAELMPLDDAQLAREVTQKCHINDKNDYDCVTQIDLTILKNEARNLVSRIDLPFLETDLLEVVRAEVTQPNGKPQAVPKNAIDTKTEPNPDLGFTRNKQTSIAFSQIGPGTKISYTVHTINRSKPFITEFDIHEYPSTGQPVRTDRYDYELTADRRIFSRTEYFDQFALTESADGKTLSFHLKAPATWSYIREYASTYERKIPHINISSSLSMADHYKKIAAKYNEITAQPIPPNALNFLQTITDLSNTDKVNRIMQYLYENYRYLGDWRASERGFVPFDLAQIETHGYGDCKDLSVLLTAMLKHVGISANTALVYRGLYAPNVLIPGLNNANHAIVRANVDDKVIWLDPTNPYLISSFISTDINDRWVFIIEPNDTVKFDHIDATPSPTPVTRLTTMWFQADKTAKVKGEYSSSGYDSDFVSINLQDRQSSENTTNKMLCTNMGEQTSDCVFNPRHSQYLLSNAQKLTYDYVENKPTERISPRKYLLRTGSTKSLNDLIRYAKENQVLDYYAGEPGSSRYITALKNLKLMDYPQSCHVESPVLDIELKVDPRKDSSALKYQLDITRKKRWLSREDIVSQDFQKQLNAGLDCLEQLNLILEVPDQASPQQK